jgi:signal transduction histidine kinase
MLDMRLGACQTDPRLNRAHSSVGQSRGLIILWSQVRPLLGPPLKAKGKPVHHPENKLINLHQALFLNMSETFGVVEVFYDEQGQWVDCVLREANPAFEQASGLSRDQFIDRSVSEFMRDTPDLQLYLDLYVQVDRTGTPAYFEASYPPQNRFFQVSAFSLGDHKVGVLSIDTTERVLAQQKLRELTAELVRAEEKERARIADILHEDLQQILVAAQYTLSGLHALPRDEQIQTSRRLMDMLTKAVETSRFVTTALRPPALYELGVGAAFFWLAEQMKQKHGLTVDLQVAVAAEPASLDVRIFIFQAVRELLFNVVKHAGVSLVHVRMGLDDHDRIQVEVCDAGAGFPDSKIQPRGFGLFSIRERVGLLGGRLDIQSAVGKGTRVCLTLPKT